MAKRPGLSVTELQQQVFDREGFRVVFERLGASNDEIAAYEYPVMAPQAWKVSDWRRMRLGKYLLVFRGVTVYDGKGEPLTRDVKLGHLRDTYYAATYGTLNPEDPPDNVVELATHTRTRAGKAKR
jgi:hypothetical protein